MSENPSNVRPAAEPPNRPADNAAASSLSYERRDAWVTPPARSSVPAIALVVAIIHAVFSSFFAVEGGTVHADGNAGLQNSLIMLVLQFPSGGIALALGIYGHRFLDGRKLAGPAVWIVAIVPAATCLLQLALAAYFRTLSEGRTALLLGVVAIDLLIILCLRNRILKDRKGPIPVIAIGGVEDPLR